MKAVVVQRLFGATVLICACWFTGVAGSADSTEERLWELRVTSRSLLALPDTHFSGVRRLADGSLLFRTADNGGMHRLAPTDGRMTSFSLQGVPQEAVGTVEFGADFDVDAKGDVYVPGMWREGKANAPLKAALFVFAPGGRHKATRELSVAGRPERIAVDGEGNAFVLAVDPQCLKRRDAECQLLHKYTSNGEHVRAFSSYPSGFPPEGAARTGPDIAGLRAETQRGHLWIRDGKVFQVLPVSRQVRTFQTDGTPLGEVRLVPPRRSNEPGLIADRAADQVWRIVGLPDGRYLVNWLHVESAGSGGQRRTNYLAVHDASGRAITMAASPAPRPSIPFDCDREGNVYLIHLTSATQAELLVARLHIQ